MIVNDESSKSTYADKVIDLVKLMDVKLYPWQTDLIKQYISFRKQK